VTSELIPGVSNVVCESGTDPGSVLVKLLDDVFREVLEEFDRGLAEFPVVDGGDIDKNVSKAKDKSPVENQ